MNNDPWPHINLENFLSQERFNEIVELSIKEHEYLDMFGFYSRSGHYTRFVKEDIIPEVTFDLFDGLPIRDYDAPLRKIIHWSIHPAGFSYPAHIDNNSRISTAVLYVTPDHNKGTILCKNNSGHVKDHGTPDQEPEYEIETPWSPNTLFLHNSIDGKTWHRYEASTQRCTLNVFFVQPDRIVPGRLENRFLI